MSDREFIHMTADVDSALRFAFEHGFQVRLDKPQLEPHPCMLDPADMSSIKRGVFFLFRPEWVFGPWDIWPIPGGYNTGKFSVSPNVNHTSIEAYFHGETMDEGRRKLGGGSVSYRPEWLEMPSELSWKVPRDVRDWWKRIVSHLSSGLSVKAGVHTYHICKGVVGDPEAALCLPPFDFIPWGPQVLNRNADKR